MSAVHVLMEKEEDGFVSCVCTTYAPQRLRDGYDALY